MIAFWKKRFVVDVRFKSGNTIRIVAKTFNLKYDGDVVTNLEWKLYVGRLMYIDLSQIESVMIVKTKGWF